jgi:hypothetical protein
MNRRFPNLTMSFAAIALLSLPLSSAAQTPEPQPPAAAQQPPTAQAPPAQQPPSQTQPPMTQQPPTASQPPAAQPPATMPPPQTPTGTTGDTARATTPNGAIVLLDRISELVDRSLGDKDALARDKANETTSEAARPTGTSGTIKVGKANAGQVSVDRAVLDEIKAEVEQLKTMLSDKKP